ncbi:MAG: ATP-dependent RNA helicase [Spirochaetales bacterium]|nr:ATP-dependent RNA helicase [Spirochaetales bacterium]
MKDFKSLPVYRHKNEILKGLEENQVIVVESPTGSGKTTQIPLILKEAGYDEKGIIGVTQPRRIAALSICDFIKKQLQITDNYCAYTMRFDDTSDSSTRIKIMTDGILLQECKADHYLSRYSVIMVDEAHERSLNIDFILGLLKDIIKVRKDLKVIISSATINTESFSKFFDGARIVSIDAEVFPITINYLPPSGKRPQAEDMAANIRKIVTYQARKHLGDVLIFLPGEFDIKETELDLKGLPVAKDLEIYPLYGRLSKEEQERVFTPTGEGKTKVVISTNIAETSITIDGITCVIDSGLCKMNFYNQRDFTSSLVPLPISKASCRQRAGRAGRTQSGSCYRLYSEENLNTRPDYSMEEILRSDLAEVALRMSDLGIYDYERFPFITQPKKGALLSAEQTLKFIQAIDDDHHLTPIGEKMVLFPLLPRLSRIIVESIMNYPDVIEEVLIAVSFLSTKGPFLLPQGQETLARDRQKLFQDQMYGDFVGYLKLFRMYEKNAELGQKSQEKFCKKYFLDYQTMNEILHIDAQIGEIVSNMGVPLTGGGQVSDYLTCLSAGLLQYVCYNYNRSAYRSLTADQIFIHPGSAWFRTLPKFLLAGEIVQTSRMFARTVSPLRAEWLDRIDPNLRNRLLHKEHLDRKAEKLVEEKKPKQNIEKKTPENIIRIFDRDYPTRSYKAGKIIAIVPLTDLPFLIKRGFERGSVRKGVKVILKNKDALLETPISLKELVQEGGILNIKGGTIDWPKDINLDTGREEGRRELERHLSKLFTVASHKDKLRFIGLMALGGDRGLFSFRSFTSLSLCIDSTYAALYEIKTNLKAPKGLMNKIDALMKRVEELEDF